MNSKKLGILGEKIAENYLKKKGYQILDKNYSPKFISGPKRGEIDIVAKKENTISFIEVKTLIQDSPRTVLHFSPEEKVNFKKKRKVIKIAESWLVEKKLSLDSQWEIDVISVRINSENKKAKILYFSNV